MCAVAILIDGAAFLIFFCEISLWVKSASVKARKTAVTDIFCGACGLPHLNRMRITQHDLKLPKTLAGFGLGFKDHTVGVIVSRILYILISYIVFPVRTI